MATQTGTQTTTLPGIPTEPLPQDGELEAEDYDSTIDGETGSMTTSVNSSMYTGYVENGRRYQTLREGATQYPVPSDDRQFESMEAGHLVHIILECQQENPLFRSPIPDSAQHILDLGTGKGEWAQAVADRYPDATVRGVDLYPPPAKWMSPNLFLEVDDVTKPWLYTEKFDLIHLRLMLGSFPYEEWDRLYRRAYEHLLPGGWIEHIEVDGGTECIDDSMPADSLMAGSKDLLYKCTQNSGNPMDLIASMRERIEKAGFVNVHEKSYKIPLGDWPKHPIYKDAGRQQMNHWRRGIDGWYNWLLTKYGHPNPWSQEEATSYLTKLKEEVKQNYWHLYNPGKRVWAQKPYSDSEVDTERK